MVQGRRLGTTLLPALTLVGCCARLGRTDAAFRPAAGTTTQPPAAASRAPVEATRGSLRKMVARRPSAASSSFYSASSSSSFSVSSSSSSSALGLRPSRGPNDESSPEKKEKKEKGRSWLTSGDADGSSRAGILFAIVMALNVWLFTIPPEFRRASICPSTDWCANHPAEVCDCVPFEAWAGDIAEYYRNGGGIRWDFSVDPNTVRANRDKMESLLGR